MELFPFSYAYAYVYAYVIPVHTYFSYFSYAYVYVCAYAYVKVWTNPRQQSDSQDSEHGTYMCKQTKVVVVLLKT